MYIHRVHKANAQYNVNRSKVVAGIATYILLRRRSARRRTQRARKRVNVRCKSVVAATAAIVTLMMLALMILPPMLSRSTLKLVFVLFMVVVVRTV